MIYFSYLGNLLIFSIWTLHIDILQKENVVGPDGVRVEVHAHVIQGEIVGLSHFGTGINISRQKESIKNPDEEKFGFIDF